MKDFHCSDVGMSCDFVARGKSNDEVLRKAAEHSREAHDIAMTREVSDTIESLIHEVDSQEHERSMARKESPSGGE